MDPHRHCEVCGIDIIAQDMGNGPICDHCLIARSEQPPLTIEYLQKENAGLRHKLQAQIVSAEGLARHLAAEQAKALGVAQKQKVREAIRALVSAIDSDLCDFCDREEEP